METGLAVDGNDDHPAATRPAAQVRSRRSAPDQFGHGDGRRAAGTGPDASTAFPPPPVNGTGPDASTAFPPPPVNGTGPDASTAFPPPPVNGTAAGVASPGAGAPAAHRIVLPPAESTGPENRLPIFESVESDWFRRGGHKVGAPAAQPAAEEVSWSSPADAGWQAAEAARAPVFADTTEAGLPKRVPKANLVPGGAGSPAAAMPPAPGRTASQTRQRLSNFQQGIRKARATGPGDETPIEGEADRAS